MTAVEFLIKEFSEILGPLKTVTDLLLLDAYNKAKEMEKEQIERAFYDGMVTTITKPDEDMLKLTEQYYNETFKSE